MGASERTHGSSSSPHAADSHPPSSGDPSVAAGAVPVGSLSPREVSADGDAREERVDLRFHVERCQACGDDVVAVIRTPDGQVHRLERESVARFDVRRTPAALAGIYATMRAVRCQCGGDVAFTNHHEDDLHQRSLRSEGTLPR